MTSVSLHAHPAFPGAGVGGIQVAISRSRAGALTLSYVVTGHIGDLRFPSRAAPSRTDGLWKHTCFEAFLRGPDGDAYWEFNLAPSAQWAAYAFSAYRERAADPGVPAPFIDAEGGRTRFELRAAVNAGAVAGLPMDAAWRVGLSAVIEHVDGARSYWALAHPQGQPDFHHVDGFTLNLPAPGHP